MSSEQKKSKLNAFDLLLLRNAARVRKLDSAITYLSPFLPGQTPSAAIGSEAAASITVLLNIYMDQVVTRLTPQREKSLDSKFLDAVYSRHHRYRVLAYFLSIIKSSELFVEMTAQYLQGRKGQWRAIIGVESVKAALRLGMLGLSQRAMPSNVPVHEPNMDPSDVDELVNGVERPCARSGRSGKVLPEPLNRDARLTLKRPDLDAMKSPIELVHRLDSQQALAEVLHILRPLAYALILYKYRSKRRSWTPWVIGIAIEFIARQLAQGAQKKNPLRKPTGLEKEITGNRDKDFLWWLMRGAMYERVSRPVLDRFASTLMKVPIVKIAGILVEDWMYLFDEYYFGAATM